MVLIIIIVVIALILFATEKARGDLVTIFGFSDFNNWKKIVLQGFRR